MTPLHWEVALNITPFQGSVAEQWQRNHNLCEVSSIDTKPLQKMSLYTWEHQGTAGGWARRTCLGNLQMGARQELFMESTWGLYLCVGLFKWVSAEQHKFKQADLPAIRTTPPLCAGFGFLATRMEKNKKRGRGDQLFTGLPGTNQGSQKKSSVPIECPLPSPLATSRQALQGVWAQAARAVRALHGQASGSIWKPLENTSKRLFTEPSHSPYAEEKWKVGKEKHKQGKGADDLLLMYRLQPTNTSDLYFSFSVREKLSYF